MVISHACKNLVSQMLHLHFLLHEARLLSSEEQKEVDGKPWGGEKLPSGLGIGLHKSETKKSKERNEKKSVQKQKGQRQLYGKKRTARLHKRQQKGLHCTETDASRVGSGALAFSFCEQRQTTTITSHSGT